jgi:hypothetical protein
MKLLEITRLRRVIKFSSLGGSGFNNLGARAVDTAGTA